MHFISAFFEIERETLVLFHFYANPIEKTNQKQTIIINIKKWGGKNQLTELILRVLSILFI